MKSLIRFHSYTREEIHDVFSPNTIFTPQAGTWGLSGIVKVPDRYGDYVFFITFGQRQGDHSFNESVTEDGILTWQSQPSQNLSEQRIRQFIRHDHARNNIYLFLRADKKKKYTYMGRLAYIDHDTEQENPVHFKWQILDWDIPVAVLQEMNLRLAPRGQFEHSNQVVREINIESSPPDRESRRRGRPTREFRGRFVDYTENERESRNVGLAGELFILEYETRNLRENGREDLAKKIVHVPEEEGDGVGYDIRSFHLDGTLKYIEVKTTRRGANTSFEITANELAFSRANPEIYYVYRVFDFDPETQVGRFYRIKGDLSSNFTLLPTRYRATRFLADSE
ncbi:DUF3427 domain-containing protein [Dendrosporobacter sp. 1207_IL3150]|uniref:DUF3427 domain-containing protein n=1 Tax=Dendrosporobacter sp. 1207_IL3150 TaxID=3084054 RepID=UPI002FDB82CC